jgi:hypothetical protein
VPTNPFDSKPTAKRPPPAITYVPPDPFILAIQREAATPIEPNPTKWAVDLLGGLRKTPPDNRYLRKAPPRVQ